MRLSNLLKMRGGPLSPALSISNIQDNLQLHSFTEVLPVHSGVQRPVRDLGLALRALSGPPPLPTQGCSLASAPHTALPPLQILLLPEPVCSTDRLQHLWLWLGAHRTQGPHTGRSPGNRPHTTIAPCLWPCSSPGEEMPFSLEANYSPVKPGTKHRGLNSLNSLLSPSSWVCILIQTSTRFPQPFWGVHSQRSIHSALLQLHLAFPREPCVHSFIS